MSLLCMNTKDACVCSGWSGQGGWMCLLERCKQLSCACVVCVSSMLLCTISLCLITQSCVCAVCLCIL